MSAELPTAEIPLNPEKPRVRPRPIDISVPLPIFLLSKEDEEAGKFDANASTTAKRAKFFAALTTNVEKQAHQHQHKKKRSEVHIAQLY